MRQAARPAAGPKPEEARVTTIDPRLRAALRAALALGPATRLLAFTADALDASDCKAVAHLAVCSDAPWPAHGPSAAVVADPLRLPFVAALFDRVVVTGTLEHSDAPAALLREVRRVLAPAGVALLAVPRRGLGFGHGLPGQHYSRARLDRLLAEAMLTPVDWTTVGGMHLIRATPRGGPAPARAARGATAFRTAPA